MKRAWAFFFAVIAAAVFLVGNARAQARAEKPGGGAAENSASGTYDVDGFIAEQQRLSEILSKKPSSEEMGRLRDALPAYWTVRTPDGSYTISSEYLKVQLLSGNSDDAKLWVDHMIGEARGYSEALLRAKKTTGDAHRELDKILGGSEFAAVHPPSAWDTFRQRLSAWMLRMLGKLFGGMARYPIGGEILFWLIVVAGVGFIALWVFRFLASRERMEAMPGSEIVNASRTWQEWIRMAREAAGRNDFRKAVHAAYWAGIARLEDAGVVPKDRTKTPREYLRLVTSAPGELMAARPMYREPLTELTKRLERVWYANRGAGPEDYQQTLRQLEAMGCQLE
ncbi:MAG: DUF4129 domain-containing protein [Candidatus Acidiferrum sp.]